METIFYVVKNTGGAFVYGSLDDAKAATRILLDTPRALVIIIERYEMVYKLSFSSKYVSYSRRIVATREDYKKATEHERSRLIAQVFAKSRIGFAFTEAFVFSTDGQGHYYGSLNGRPADCAFLAERPLKYVECLAIILNR